VTGRPPKPLPGDGSQLPDGERERLVAAVAKTASEHGYAGLTVERIVHYSGLDRETFDAHFQSRDQGLLAAQEAFLERLLGDATHACEQPEPWPQRLRAGLHAVLSSLLESADLARVFVVEAGPTAGLALADRQMVALEDFARLLRSSRRDWPAAARLPDVTERLLVGGIASLVNQRLLREEGAATPSLQSELTEFLLFPYLGAGEARRIALEPPEL
jgi:AcrR family transcriptional regulator